MSKFRTVVESSPLPFNFVDPNSAVLFNKILNAVQSQLPTDDSIWKEVDALPSPDKELVQALVTTVTSPAFHGLQTPLPGLVAPHGAWIAAVESKVNENWVSSLYRTISSLPWQEANNRVTAMIELVTVLCAIAEAVQRSIKAAAGVKKSFTKVRPAVDKLNVQMRSMRSRVVPIADPTEAAFYEPVPVAEAVDMDGLSNSLRAGLDVYVLYHTLKYLLSFALRMIHRHEEFQPLVAPANAIQTTVDAIDQNLPDERELGDEDEE